MRTIQGAIGLDPINRYFTDHIVLGRQNGLPCSLHQHIISQRFGMMDQHRPCVTDRANVPCQCPGVDPADARYAALFK